MPLANGTRLGPYEISGLLGAGGMGEVYCARDTRLERMVAVEVLPTSFFENHEALGRARWMPDGRAIAFLGQNETGVNGVFVQDFAPGLDTIKTRRPLGGFDPEAAAESFGIAPDGTRLVVAGAEHILSIALAEGLPGIDPPLRPFP